VCSAPAESLLTTDPDAAVAALRAGRLAALPTETVYGLGADARRPSAVARVYAVKGRPADHPLIVHLPHAAALSLWARDVPEYASRLADACWPGPLTLVLPRSARAGDHVTGGQDTVGLRVPDHPLTTSVLERFGDGVAAPSANRFGRVSPTTAQHVLDELAQALLPGHDVVLDGGPSGVGVESTIVDCTGTRPRILRPGAVGAEEVERVGGVPLAPPPPRGSGVRAPGMLASHYAPRARVSLVDEDGAAAAGVGAVTGDPDTGLLAPAPVPTPPGVVRLAAPAGAGDYARALYAALREADALGLTRVLAVPPPGEGLAAAVRDRLTRAAAGRSGVPRPLGHPRPPRAAGSAREPAGGGRP
jgi:L-threonylcarbamoyladenylate synthase